MRANWKPIETAPKGDPKNTEGQQPRILAGKWIQIGDPFPPFWQVTVAFWRYEMHWDEDGNPTVVGGHWELAVCGDYATDSDVQVTHWMPLPEPPEISTTTDTKEKWMRCAKRGCGHVYEYQETKWVQTETNKHYGTCPKCGNPDWYEATAKEIAKAKLTTPTPDGGRDKERPILQ